MRGDEMFDYNLRNLLEWVKEYGDDGDLPNQDGSGGEAYRYAKELLIFMDVVEERDGV